MSSPALALDDVSHSYGAVRAVIDLSLAVAPGEVVCLLGPSGCGKSTVLRLAAGLEEVQAGRIAINGILAGAPGTHVPPEDRNVGLVFQDFALFPHLTICNNVGFGLRSRDPVVRRERILAALGDVGLVHAEQAFPHMLSGGEQQRVALARALAPRPRLVLLDEPFSGLDARLREQVRDVTVEALRKSGTATLMVTHDAEEAMFMADRIAVMRDGRIVQEGTPIDLYRHPISLFVAAFFGEINRLAGTARHGEVATRFGPVPTGLADGAAAEVVIRPEALRVSLAGETGSGTVPARVVSAHPLGRSTRLVLALDDGHRVKARIWGLYHPAVGAPVMLALDPRQAFVFPVD
ncbi:MAG: ABC transporter ATP-binding protein [Alphaproteobacteria bacterium]|nr:ABC transporter ATP-binding protein [Alphaproteobacteria bacterium]